MNFFKLYIGDYQRDTAHLSIAEHGAYMLLLQDYAATEKPLPSGKALHRMLRAQDKTEREAIDSVATQFWLTTDDGLVNDRADVEITKAAAQADTNARIAREREDRRKAARKPNEQSTNRATNGQPNQTPDSSVPNGTGGEPPDKPAAEKSKSQLWKAAVSLLAGQGMPEPQARTFIGRLAKDYPHGDIVQKAVEAAVSEQPPDARAYLKATCQRLAGEQKKRADSSLFEGAV